jgi:hypothetical protein
MFSGDPSTARQEAEHLVVTALAAATLAAKAYPSVATGSAACCVCPFCKVIEAVREPDPEFVERLASGAGDLAVGIAGLMRHLAGAGTPTSAGTGVPDDVWRAATAPEDPAAPTTAGATGPAYPASASTTTGDAPAPADRVTPAPVRQVAKKALKRAAPADPPTPADGDQAPRPVPKKAVRPAPPPRSE